MSSTSAKKSPGGQPVKTIDAKMLVRLLAAYDDGLSTAEIQERFKVPVGRQRQFVLASGRNWRDHRGCLSRGRKATSAGVE